MGNETKIQWTDATINYWHGCKKISPGCKFCYMYRDKEKYGQDGNVILKTSKKTIEGIYRKLKEPSLIFTCSWSDFFLREADEWRDEAWEDIKNHPQHIYQILTKRPENIPGRLPLDFHKYKNVWLGVSIETDEYSSRAFLLHKLKENYPELTTFISFEPLLGRIGYRSYFESIDWIIIGGESGNETGKYNYRPCELEWIEEIVSAFKGDKPIHIKQLGTYLKKKLRLKHYHGGDISEFPTHLQIREYPNVNR